MGNQSTLYREMKAIISWLDKVPGQHNLIDKVRGKGRPAFSLPLLGRIYIDPNAPIDLVGSNPGGSDFRYKVQDGVTIGHEIGDVIGGRHDDGPGQMINVHENEWPVERHYRLPIRRYY